MAVSRFKYRGGVFLYGKLRRTDFLPVGEDVQARVGDVRGAMLMVSEMCERLSFFLIF